MLHYVCRNIEIRENSKRDLDHRQIKSKFDINEKGINRAILKLH